MIITSPIWVWKKKKNGLTLQTLFYVHIWYYPKCDNCYRIIIISQDLLLFFIYKIIKQKNENHMGLWHRKKWNPTFTQTIKIVLWQVYSLIYFDHIIYKKIYLFHAFTSFTKRTSRSLRPTSDRLECPQTTTRFGKFVVISNSSGACGWLNTKSYKSWKSYNDLK